MKRNYTKNWKGYQESQVRKNRQIYITPKLNDVFSAAEKEAERLHDEYVSTEHILGVTEIGDSASGILKMRVYQKIRF